MTSTGTCKECGTALPKASPGGFCPRCMLSLAMKASPDEPASSPDAFSVLSSASKAADDQRNRAVLEANMGEKIGDRIGGYRLLQEIGHGGCGVVYMAEQEMPVRRKVALKVIKIGMDTRQVVARFDAERQVLARMDHPNIAKVLDAGATSGGRPYFAMELVGGVKITDYCDENQLTTRERLQLFVQVCRAIQHAHQKGIIHRDIKPSNVLVAQHDGVAVPKVIDFGIAKATQGKLIDETLFTAFEQFIGTPVYMSPEQAEPGGLDVDTRSDIYSLGVLLYELLTGKTPFQMDSSRAAGMEAIRRTVVEKEPIKPSTRLSTMCEDQLTQVARIRQIEGPRLVKLLRGDLDWIVMKCLEKDRGRRYATANGLAMDLDRYLNLEPVLARPPSTVYRIQKFVSRNRVVTLSAASVALALILGSGVSTWQAIKANQAKREQTRLMREAQAAKQEATEKLWSSYAAEARARRLSREAGASFESLAAIAKAAAIHPSLQLRNEAIAALAQADIRLVSTKPFGVKTSFAIDLSAPRYATCDEFGKISICRESDDAELASLPPMNSRATKLWPFSPDGVFLQVFYADDRLRLWDWEHSRCVLEVQTPFTAAFSSDSKQLALNLSGQIVLFDLPSGSRTQAKESSRLKVDPGEWGLTFDPARSRLAAYNAAQTNLLILDLNSDKSVVVPCSDRLHPAVWSPDGKHLAAACLDNFVHIWDSESGKEFRKLPSYQTIRVIFNPHGDLLVTSGWDGKTRLFDFPNCRELVNIYHSGAIVGFRPDGRSLIETDWDRPNTILLEVANPRGLHTLRVHESVGRGPSGFAAFSRDGRFLAFNDADGMCVWDVEADLEIGFCHGGVAVAGFDSEDRHLIGVDSGGLLLWPISALRERSSGKGRVASAHSSAELPLPIRPAEKILGGTGTLSPDGEYCFLAGSNRCQILSTHTFKESVITGIHKGSRFSAANRDASLIATGGWHAPGVMIWDGRNGKLIKSLDTPDTTSVALSPDGQYLVTASADQYRFWQVGSWSPVFTISQQKDNDFVPVMVFSPDGRILAGTHSRSIVRLHDAATGQVLADLEPPDRHAITCLCFNNDGTRLAVCEGYEAARIWDLKVIRSHLASIGLDWEDAPHSSSTRAAR